MRRYIPLLLAITIGVAVYLYWRALRPADDSPYPAKIQYTLISNMVLEALLADTSFTSRDTFRLARANKAQPAPPVVEDLISTVNHHRRDETNALASMGIIGTCCCPCEEENQQVSLLGHNGCPCPEFQQMRFLAPAETEAETFLDDIPYKKEPLKSRPEKWVVFSLAEDTPLVDGEYTLRFKGRFFETTSVEEFHIHITIRSGKAYLRK